MFSLTNLIGPCFVCWTPIILTYTVAQTDRRVISYTRDDGELSVSSATFAEILFIEPEYPEGAFDDTSLMVETEDEYIYLFLSTEKGLDRVFIEELERRIAQGE